MRKAILLLALALAACSSAPKEPEVKEVVVTKVERLNAQTVQGRRTV